MLFVRAQDGLDNSSRIAMREDLTSAQLVARRKAAHSAIIDQKVDGQCCNLFSALRGGDGAECSALGYQSSLVRWEILSVSVALHCCRGSSVAAGLKQDFELTSPLCESEMNRSHS